MKRILLIGMGAHARHFYLPRLSSGQVNLELVAVMDLRSNEENCRAFWRTSIGLTINWIFADAFVGDLPSNVEALLDQAVKELNVDGVIISTDPLSHKVYAMWALRRHLHILMDKPITSRRDAALDKVQAEGIFTDFEDLRKCYTEQEGWKRAFVILAHRRYHNGLHYCLNEVKRVCRLTGCPLTYYHGYHSDGQWRLPTEILTQSHHSYNEGHGKLSHSGYHFVDTLVQFWRAGEISGKSADGVDVQASFVFPEGLLHQIGREQYAQFWPNYAKSSVPPDDELRQSYRTAGEIDVNMQFNFKKAGVPVGMANLILLHNGYSRRTWLAPGKDLYKGNGRTKHEQHCIQVGPFLSIQVHSCQAKDRHKVSGPEDLEIGGNNHFEIWVFRNPLVAGDLPAFQKLRLPDLEDYFDGSHQGLHIESIKEVGVHEFQKIMDGSLNPPDSLSDFCSHETSVRLMSAGYQAAVQRENALPLWVPL